jgi:hypothetical protein
MESVLRQIGGADEGPKDLWSMHEWLNMLDRALTKTEEKGLPKLTTNFCINNVNNFIKRILHCSAISSPSHLLSSIASCFQTLVQHL